MGVDSPVYDLLVYTGLTTNELAAVFGTSGSPVLLEKDFFEVKDHFFCVGSLSSQRPSGSLVELAERAEQDLGMVAQSELWTDTVQEWPGPDETAGMREMLRYLKASGVSFYVLGTAVGRAQVAPLPLWVGQYDARQDATRINPNFADTVGRILL